MFLDPLLDATHDRLAILNSRDGAVLASMLEPAFDSKTRRKGLLGRTRLEDGCAVILAPCNSVHTFFMRFPIDVVFATKTGVVVKIVHELAAWRLCASLRAFATIELAAGSAARAGLRVGDRLTVAPHGPAPFRVS